MVAGSQIGNKVDVLVAHLHEAHDLSVYEAVERLVQTADAVGLDIDTLVRMLDQGVTFEEILESIEMRLKDSPRAA